MGKAYILFLAAYSDCGSDLLDPSGFSCTCPSTGSGTRCHAAAVPAAYQSCLHLNSNSYLCPLCTLGYAEKWAACRHEGLSR
jgi:hypothetical protein